MRGMDYETRFIDLADKVNSQMPHYVVGEISDEVLEAIYDNGYLVLESKKLLTTRMMKLLRPCNLCPYPEKKYFPSQPCPKVLHLGTSTQRMKMVQLGLHL